MWTQMTSYKWIYKENSTIKYHTFHTKTWDKITSSTFIDCNHLMSRTLYVLWIFIQTLKSFYLCKVVVINFKWLRNTNCNMVCLGSGFWFHVFNLDSRRTKVLGFQMPIKLDQESCIFSSQPRCMHLDELLKCTRTHQAWYCVCKMLIALPKPQNRQCPIVENSLNLKLSCSTRCEVNDIKLLLWWFSPFYN